jgi:hypothetical protein
MAVSDTTSDSLRLRRIDTVPADANVKHVDQLDDSVYHTVAGAANGNAHELDASATELTAGDVVVFTDYLRVERT